jgi:hypothetical protein
MEGFLEVIASGLTWWINHAGIISGREFNYQAPTPG